MRTVSIKRGGQWTFFTTFHFTPTGRKGNCMSKMIFLFGITACNCLNINETLHNRILQDKEITVRHDCDQSERVFLQNIPHLLVNTESLLSLLLFTFLKEILTIYNF